MKNFISFIVAFVVFLTSTQATAQSSCQEFESAIDAGIMTIALRNVDGAAEKSAPRQTNINTEINNELQLISINIQLMMQNKCPVRKTPINPMIHFSEALDCQMARLKDEKNSPACDMKNWKGLRK